MKIERVTIEDAQELLSIYAPYVEKTAITFEYDVPSIAEFEGRIRDISSKYPYIKAVGEACDGEELNGKILGYAYAGCFKGRAAYDWSVETTIYLRMDQKRKGLGTALYAALESSLKDMGILNLNACIAVAKVEDAYLTNDSVYFHESQGYQTVGTFHDSGYKFDTWYDMIWMEKMIGEHPKKVEPVRFGEWKLV